MSPLSIIATLSHIEEITSISWVITTTVMPIFLFKSFKSASIDFVVLGSRADVASSHNITFGSVAKALAIATLCFCPPES